MVRQSTFLIQVNGCHLDFEDRLTVLSLEELYEADSKELWAFQLYDTDLIKLPLLLRHRYY